MSDHPIVDLRSDTVTRPTPAMRQAMAAAEVGDDVWGDDPTAHRLEQHTAELLGFEAALFVPSGTMGNLLAQLLHCERGDEIIVGRWTHLCNDEGGAGAALAGVQYREVGDDGTFDAEALETAVRPPSPYVPRSRLVVVENTHNRSGGRCWPRERLRSVVERARALGLRLHLDGARLWNAAVAQGVAERELAAGFDTASVCFSKGLGAPAGSALCGPAELIAQARRWRRRLGGAMRQVGVLCAAALYALEHHRDRLAEDHARARRLAEALAEMPGLRCDPRTVETNMVYFEPPPGQSAARFAERAAERGVLLAAVGPRRIRAVTHLDVDDGSIGRVIDVLSELCRHGA